MSEDQTAGSYWWQPTGHADEFIRIRIANDRKWSKTGMTPRSIQPTKTEHAMKSLLKSYAVSFTDAFVVMTGAGLGVIACLWLAHHVFGL